jgi:hypothetical protein
MWLLSILYYYYRSAFDSFPDALNFDKRPFSRSNAIIAFFYTVAEKPLGSSNLKKQVTDN